jgi:selenocysteine lyase/cysteine desulfurase
VHEQSAGVLPLGVEPDWVAVHGYKWLLAPRGAAWLHVRPDRVAGTRPLAPNHKGTTSPWTDYYGGPLALAPDARRFDMSLGWPAWAAAGTALDLVASLDSATVDGAVRRAGGGVPDRVPAAGPVSESRPPGREMVGGALTRTNWTSAIDSQGCDRAATAIAASHVTRTKPSADSVARRPSGGRTHGLRSRHGGHAGP